MRGWERGERARKGSGGGRERADGASGDGPGRERSGASDRAGIMEGRRASEEVEEGGGREASERTERAGMAGRRAGMAGRRAGKGGEGSEKRGEGAGLGRREGAGALLLLRALHTCRSKSSNMNQTR